jgi:Phage integrase, N-terminal SAM-like domain
MSRMLYENTGMRESPYNVTLPRRAPIPARAPLGKNGNAASARYPAPIQFPEGMRLLASLRYAVRARHYSYKTEQAYVYWAREFIRFNNLTHPAEMGGNEVRRFVDNRPCKSIARPLPFAKQ